MGFTNAGWPQQHHILDALHEGQAGQLLDLLPRRACRKAKSCKRWFQALLLAA
jgi:hypothetical protein